MYSLFAAYALGVGSVFCEEHIVEENVELCVCLWLQHQLDDGDGSPYQHCQTAARILRSGRPELRGFTRSVIQPL